MSSTPQKQDRRVRRTQKAIEQAFAELMATKDINSITVSELAEKADIHRATFYSHYSDIPSLYETIQKSVVAGLETIVAPDPERGKNMNGEEVFGMMVDYVYDRKEIFKMLLTRSSTREFFEELAHLFETLYLEIFWSDVAEDISRDDLQVLAKYHVSGCIAVISDWTEKNFADSPERVIQTLAVVDGHFDKLMYRVTKSETSIFDS